MLEIFMQAQETNTHWELFEAIRAEEIVEDDTNIENPIAHREITLKHLPTDETEVFKYTINDGIITLENLET